jgi:TatA/E family protein of Tat protein translocase
LHEDAGEPRPKGSLDPISVDSLSVFFLSPAKLLLVLVVILIVVGPDKLPSVARQLGAAIESLRNLHAKVEKDVRESIPNLPSTAQIAKMARSPSVLLNTLMEMPSDADDPVPDPGSPAAQANGAGNDTEDFPIDTGAPMTMDTLSPEEAAIANGRGAHGPSVSTVKANGSAPASPAAAPASAQAPKVAEEGTTPFGDPSMN